MIIILKACMSVKTVDLPHSCLFQIVPENIIMFTTIMNVLVKCTTHTCGIITIFTIMQCIIIEHMSIPAWILSNVWGCACMFVFMDGVALANDLKITENKYKALEIQYDMMEMFYKSDKQEYIEGKGIHTKREYIVGKINQSKY
jgi:hypothetical protein